MDGVADELPLLPALIDERTTELPACGNLRFCVLLLFGAGFNLAGRKTRGDKGWLMDNVGAGALQGGGEGTLAG